MAEETNEAPQVFALGGNGRRRGRPRVTPGESTLLHVRIWSDHYDALFRQARAERKEFSEYVRGILAGAAKRG